jgi:hypothetical protein
MPDIIVKSNFRNDKRDPMIKNHSNLRFLMLISLFQAHTLRNFTWQPQCLRHLSTLYPPVPPEGAFLDYFAVALGTLSMEWMKQPLDTIPHVFHHNYRVLKWGKWLILSNSSVCLCFC